MAENSIDQIKHVLINKKEQAVRKSDDFQRIYANNVHLSASIFDFSLTFGEITDDETPEGKSIVEQSVRIVLSKEMTKVLSALLDTNIKAYEEHYGEIVVTKPKQPTKEQQILASAARRKKK
jgi:hypothetical protein